MEIPPPLLIEGAGGLNVNTVGFTDTVAEAVPAQELAERSTPLPVTETKSPAPAIHRLPRYSSLESVADYKVRCNKR